MLELAEILRPKLIKDGMFLVGIDIAGDKLMEINVFSPGGLNMMSAAYKADFLKVVIEAIERKVYYRKVYGDTLENKDLACL
jgi:glutathione synthase